jgi:cysteine desulfurase
MAIYLDCNATTPVDPEVYDAVLSSMKRDYGNPSSSHANGIRARQTVEKSRALVAALIGSNPGEIYFTSGGTESNNLAILGTASRHGRGHIITSYIEHPSVMNPLRHLEGKGFAVTFLPVDESGRVSVEELKNSIRKDTILITVMHSNNETGVLQPIEEIGSIARRHGIPFHTDAAQSAGKVPVDVSSLKVDMMTIVSHKFYGPKGAGALYLKEGISLEPIMFGSSHEKGLRPGTENVPGIVGLGKASELAVREMKNRINNLTKLRDMLYEGLKKEIQGVKLNGHETLRLSNTLNIVLPGIDAVDFVEALREKVSFSSGAACHSGEKSPSYVLKAMGVKDIDALSSIRLSLCKDNTEEEIKEAVKFLSDAHRLQARAP